MLKIKSAQIQDFTDVNVRRVFGYAHNIVKDPGEIEKLMNAEQELKMNNPHITFQELSKSELGAYLRMVGSENWASNDPHGGVI